MRVLKSDFEFLRAIANEFFCQSDKASTLNWIASQGLSDWEKWFQVEFHKYLYHHSSIGQVKREVEFKIDQRRSDYRLKCYVDFEIKQKYKHSPIMLEIKQSNSVQTCIKNMCADMAKINNIKSSVYYGRSLWCLGIHSAESDDEVYRRAAKVFEEFGLSYNRSLVHSEEIAGTGLSYILA